MCADIPAFDAIDWDKDSGVLARVSDNGYEARIHRSNGMLDVRVERLYDGDPEFITPKITTNPASAYKWFLDAVLKYTMAQEDAVHVLLPDGTQVYLVKVTHSTSWRVIVMQKAWKHDVFFKTKKEAERDFAKQLLIYG